MLLLILLLCCAHAQGYSARALLPAANPPPGYAVAQVGSSWADADILQTEDIASIEPSGLAAQLARKCDATAACVAFTASGILLAQVQKVDESSKQAELSSHDDAAADTGGDQPTIYVQEQPHNWNGMADVLPPPPAEGDGQGLHALLEQAGVLRQALLAFDAPETLNQNSSSVDGTRLKAARPSQKSIFELLHGEELQGLITTLLADAEGREALHAALAATSISIQPAGQGQGRPSAAVLAVAELLYPGSTQTWQEDGLQGDGATTTTTTITTTADDDGDATTASTTATITAGATTTFTTTSTTAADNEESDSTASLLPSRTAAPVDNNTQSQQGDKGGKPAPVQSSSPPQLGDKGGIPAPVQSSSPPQLGDKGGKPAPVQNSSPPQLGDVVAALAWPAWDSRDPFYTKGPDMVSCPVRNQLGCGACIAFSLAAAAEVAISSVTRQDCDASLAPQFWFFCVAAWAPTCKSGWSPDSALSTLVTHGAVYEGCYPWSDPPSPLACTDKCENTRDKRPAFLSAATDSSPGGTWAARYFTQKQIAETRDWIRKHGAVVSAFTVHTDFYKYKGGIYDWDRICAADGGHATIVYGWNDTGRYWLGKNSWGPLWGEGGYFRISYDHPTFMKQVTYGIAWTPPPGPPPSPPTKRHPPPPRPDKKKKHRPPPRAKHHPPPKSRRHPPPPRRRYPPPSSRADSTLRT